MLPDKQTNLVSNGKQQSIFAETFSKLFKENKESNMFDRFSSLSSKEKILAVSVAGAIFASALPIVAVALPLAVPGAIVALTLFFAYKAVEYTFKGLKWSAEKTVDGAKYTAGKIKGGAVHAKDKVKEGYEHSVNSLKKGASFVGEGVANKFHKASGETDYLDKVKRFTPDAIKKSDEIRNDMKAIFADKGNNSGLVENILSGISSEIDLKMAEKAKSGEIEHTSGWQVQKEFINNLNEKSLHSLLTQRSLPKGSYFIDSVFSEHHDKIKRIIGECKREYEFYQSVGRNNAKDAEERKASKSSSFSPVFSLGRKDSTQSTSSLSKSSSLDSVRTESTASSEAELLNPAEHKEVKAPSSFREKMPSWLGGKKAPKETTDVKYQVLSESGTLSVALPKLPRSNSLNSVGTGSTATVSCSDSQDFATVKPNLLRRSSSSSSLTPKLTPVAPPKPPRSPSIDSGFNSPTSSPTHTMFTNEDGKAKTQADLKETGHLDKLVRQPSTYKSEVYIERQQPEVTAGK